MIKILLKNSFLVLNEWFRFMWPFITGGRQHKEAVVTHLEVTMITL